MKITKNRIFKRDFLLVVNYKLIRKIFKKQNYYLMMTTIKKNKNLKMNLKLVFVWAEI